MMSSAAAKIILFGEHAVVYSEPAIAIPVSDLRAYATIETNCDKFQIIARDLDNKVITFESDDLLLDVVTLTLKVLGKALPHISMTIQSDIPIASGMGSGAAISTVIVRSLAAYFDVTLPHDDMNQIVYEIEKIHHGTPSGIDNTVIVYEKPIFYVKDRPIEALRVGEPFKFVIADTGQAALTKVSVGDVRRLYEDGTGDIVPIIKDIGVIAEHAKQALADGDSNVLGQLMNQNHTLLQKLTISSDELDKLTQAAIEAGALGAKLSGGGRGGNMIALVRSEQAQDISQALVEAGAARTFITTLEKTSL